MNGYIDFRSNPSNDHINDGMWCGQRHVDPDTLTIWKMQNPEAMMTILEARRSRYADELIKVDQALFEKAKSGDPRSVQLIWARFENWSPRIEEEQNKKTQGKVKTLSELIGEM